MSVIKSYYKSPSRARSYEKRLASYESIPPCFGEYLRPPIKGECRKMRVEIGRRLNGLETKDLEEVLRIIKEMQAGKYKNPNRYLRVE